MTHIGERMRRTEDPRLLRGEGRFVEDLTFPRMLHAGFVRSPHAHAIIHAVDGAGALAIPGVVALHSGTDLPELAQEVPSHPFPAGLRVKSYFPLAPSVVRFVGEPVAMVLAENSLALADAIEAVRVEYEILPAAGDPEAALADGAPLVWEDVPRNIALELTTGFGDVDAAWRDDAEVVVEERFTFPRAAGAAMEPRAVAAELESHPEGTLTIWASTQAPHNLREAIAGYLGRPVDTVRVITPDVGGGFGPKGRVYPEQYAVAAAALHHRRPVRWIATRSEDLMTTAHGRGQIHRAQLAARADGTILGLRDHLIQDAGAYAPNGLAAVMNTTTHLMGPYRVPALAVRVTGVYTNRVITSPLRGGGRPEGIFVVERLLDRLAERLGLDRAEIRRRNFIPPECFPYDTHMPAARGGTVRYDSGTYPAYLERALDAIDYRRFSRLQMEARREGRYLGLGLVAFAESTGTGTEGARIEIDEAGRAQVYVGSPSNGQGHATTFGQMAAERIGLPFESVAVISGDTAACPVGTGTFASRMGQYGGNAVSLAAQAVRERMLHLAADILEIAEADLEITEGEIKVRGVPGRRVAVTEVAREAIRRNEPLAETRTFTPSPGSTWAGGVNAAIVEVDVETGKVTILRYVVVHDAGTLVNPTVVEGQIHGGVLHGIGNALYEECVYGDGGQMLTATFVDYTLPGIGEAPELAITHFETPSPFNPEGIKGAGEGGTIAAIPTIVSAVENALAPFGVKINRVPMEPESLVQARSSATIGRTRATSS